MTKKSKKNWQKRRKRSNLQPMLLTTYNYRILAGGIFLVFSGFAGMYLEGQQYGVFALYLAPLAILAGFILVALSVFRTDPRLEAKDSISRSASQDP